MAHASSTPKLTVANPDRLSPTRASWWTRLWEPFWMVPLAMITAGFALGLLMPLIDQQLVAYIPYVFSGGTDGARSVLTTIASATISVVGLVFSITLVVLQLASSQFSPLVISTFLHNRISQTTLGIFTGTFLYSLTVLRAVRGGETIVVPQASISFGLFLAVLSVFYFIVFIRFITSAIQVAKTISALGARTKAAINQVFPRLQSDCPDGECSDCEPEAEPATLTDANFKHARTIHSTDHGVITSIHLENLTALAQKNEVLFRVLVSVGEFVPTGHAIVEVAGESGDPEFDDDEVRRCFLLRTSRSVEFDPYFGVRQIVDISSRALSSGTNDPGTAKTALFEVHELLRTAIQRPDISPVIRDSDDAERVLWQPQTIEGLLDVGFNEAIYYGAKTPSVRSVLETMVSDLASVARPEHLPHLERAKELISTMDTFGGE